MNRTDALEQIAETVRNPLKSVEKWREGTNGKVVGCLACMPPFAPEELIHAAGMLPVGIWGAEIPVRMASAKLQSFACSVARTSLEMALNGTLAVCDGYLFPSTCDAFQNLSEVWKVTIEKPCFEVTFPKQADRQVAQRYLEKEFELVKVELEEFSGASIHDRVLRRSLRVFNENRRLMRQLDRIRTRNPGLLTASQMMEIVLAASFLAKEEHSRLVRVVLETSSESGPKCLDQVGTGGEPVRVFLTGVMARPVAILAACEDLGIWVVGDDLGLGSLCYSVEVPDRGSSLCDLAEGYLRYPPCSTLHRPLPGRASELLKRVRETGAEGVLILATKFCEPEFFDYPQLKEKLAEAGVPSVLLETELGAVAPGSLRTRLEAFVETLQESKKQTGPGPIQMTE